MPDITAFVGVWRSIAACHRFKALSVGSLCAYLQCPHIILFFDWLFVILYVHIFNGQNYINIFIYQNFLQKKIMEK